LSSEQTAILLLVALCHIQTLNIGNFSTWTPSRDADTKFTCELFYLLLYYLIALELSLNDHPHLQTTIRVKLIPFTILGVLGPYKNCICHKSLDSSMETARSAAGRREARWFRKHKQAAALSFFVVACFALFAYVPLAGHSEPSDLT
jgi:hypothetical protein